MLPKETMRMVKKLQGILYDSVDQILLMSSDSGIKMISSTAIFDSHL
jgi:hypothetical protein